MPPPPQRPQPDHPGSGRWSNQGRLAVLGAALLFSTGGAAIKGIELHAWQVASFRSLIAAAFLIAVRPSLLRLLSRKTLLVALAYAGTLILFVLANKNTTAANSIFLQSTAPLYLVALGPLLLAEPVRRRDLGMMAVLGVGLALFFVSSEAPQSTAPHPLAGNLLALGAGVCWALTLAGLRWLEKGDAPRGTGLATVVLGNLLAGLACLPLAWPTGGELGSALDWSLLGVLGVGQIGVAYLLLTRGLASVPALEASLLLLAEPALSPAWAWLVHGERPGPLALVGGALILGATGFRAATTRRRANAA